MTSARPSVFRLFPKSAAFALAAASFAAASPAGRDAPGGWDLDPVGWRVDGDAFVASNAGWALAPAPKARRVEMRAVVTPLAVDNPEYSSIGIGVFDDIDRYWKFSLLKAPDSKGAWRRYEMKAGRDGEWGAEERLMKRVEFERGAEWTWGRRMELVFSFAPERVSGMVKDAETGAELYRCAWEPKPGEPLPQEAGRPALHVSGVLSGRVEEVSWKTGEEVPEDTRTFPAYRPVGPELGVAGRATGFFHMETIDGLAWTVDPLGRGVLLAGTDWCNPRGSWCETLGYSPYGRFVKEHYPSVEAWADETSGRLSDWGFTFLPCGGDESLFHRTLAHANAADRLYFSHRLCMGDPDWRIAEYRRSPCTAFPNVFHPEFQAACDWWARQRCAPHRDDPWLVGYFIDNELAWWGEVSGNKAGGLFDLVMKKPASHPAKKALVEYLAGRSPTPELKIGFLRLVAEKYFAATTSAIRKADPNHMILGCRFAGGPKGAHDVVWEVAGKYCDVVSFNQYPWVDLDRDVVLDAKGGEPILPLYAERHARCGRPLMITEWSFPALDTGRPCTSGAGQRVHTQAERVHASEIFLKTLLSQPYFAGYSFFRWLDQPEQGISKYFPEDSNYGLVSQEGVPYRELTGMFARIHSEAAKWHASPPPPERPAPPPEPSERERYFAAARVAAHTAEAMEPVSFSREGDAWTLSNGIVSLSGRVGGACMADAIAWDGEPPVGRWGALLQWNAGGEPVWTDVSRVTDVSFEKDGASGAGTVTIRAEGGESGTCFAFAHRLSLAPGSRELLAEIVSLENTGDRPFTAQCLFMRPFAANVDPPPARVKTVPNLWKGAVEGYWEFADRSRFGLSSRDEGALKFALWFRDEDSSQHPDARFMDGPAFLLEPGSVFRPSRPMGALVRRLPPR